MVKRVEGLEANFKSLRFSKFRYLVQSRVEIHHTRTVERPTREVSHSSERVRSEQRCIKVGLPTARVAVDVKVPRRDIGKINADAVDPVVLNIDQRVVRNSQT